MWGPARRHSSLFAHLNSFSMASAMRQPWAKPNWVSTARAAVRPKFSTRYCLQEAHGHGVEQERALPGETNHASFGVELQELIVMEILNTHWSFPSY